MNVMDIQTVDVDLKIVQYKSLKSKTFWKKALSSASISEISIDSSMNFRRKPEGLFYNNKKVKSHFENLK